MALIPNAIPSITDVPTQVGFKPLLDFAPPTRSSFEFRSARVNEAGTGTALERRVWLRDSDNRLEAHTRIGDPGVDFGLTRSPTLQGRQSGSLQSVEGASFEYRHRID